MPNREWCAVILAAGKIDSDLASVLSCFSPLMLPYQGRPNVYWLLAELERLGVRKVYLVVNELDDRAERFVTAHFSERIEFQFVKLTFDVSKGPGNSLLECLRRNATEIAGRRLLVINGDISFRIDDLDSGRNEATVWTTDLIDSDKYTFIATDVDNQVVVATSKPEASSSREAKQLKALVSEHHSVLTEAGVYSVRDVGPLLGRVPDLTSKSYRSVVSLMMATYPQKIDAAPLQDWWDVSHLDSLLGVSEKSVAPRAFNKVYVDQDGVFHKRSTNHDKIRAEISYYEDLPKNLKIHFPRLVDADRERAEYAIEFYPYKTLSQYLVFQGLSRPIWQRAFRKLIGISESFRAVTRPNDPAKLFEFYWTKTVSRFESAAGDARLAPLLGLGEVQVNGKTLAGFDRRRERIEHDLRQLCRIETQSLVHGDLCFSNILFDPGSTLVRLIDPRGEFIDRSCYGDYRYDLAKLLHSVHGRYDFILHGLYGLKNVNDSVFELHTIEDEQILPIQQDLFSMVRQAAGPEFRNVVLLEALLFISMIPLHHEDAQRQRAFYLTGLNILSEIYDANMY